MPGAVLSSHAALIEQLNTLATDASQLGERLEKIIALRDQDNSALVPRTARSRPPWNGAVAEVLLDLHALARDNEQLLQLTLGLPVRSRGGSDANTAAALEAIGRLCQGAADVHVAGQVSWLSSWCRRARVALGVTEMPHRLPRSPGQPEPRCPFCQDHTLRSWPLYGVIRCISPACPGDDQGRRPSARLEYSDVARDWVLVWCDGLTGVPV